MLETSVTIRCRRLDVNLVKVRVRERERERERGVEITDKEKR